MDWKFTLFVAPGLEVPLSVFRKRDDKAESAHTSVLSMLLILSAQHALPSVLAAGSPRASATKVVVCVAGKSVGSDEGDLTYCGLWC